jgi:hypothetical protein
VHSEIHCKIFFLLIRTRDNIQQNWGELKFSKHSAVFTEKVNDSGVLTGIIPNYNQQDATFLDPFIPTDALHVSGGSFAHHQEHITVHTASGTVNQYRRLPLSWKRWNSMEFPLFHDSSR